jgi:hypothetical protein
MLNELRRLLDTTPADKLGFVVTGGAADEGYGYGYGYTPRPYTSRQEPVTTEVAE